MDIARRRQRDRRHLVVFHLPEKLMLRCAASAVVLLGIAIGLYSSNLGVLPMRDDERRLQTQATALSALGGRDVAGRLLPAFVHVAGDVWLAPVPVFAAILTTPLLPAAATNVRWIAVLASSLSVALIYVLTELWLRSRRLALVAALVMLTTPGLFVYGRLATDDGIWQLPFILVWLIGLIVFARQPGGRPRWGLAVAAAALAGSVYSQPTAPLMACFFVALSGVAVWRTTGWRRSDAALAALVFIVVLVPMMGWFVAYPATYVDTFGRWFLHPAHLRDPRVWAAATSNWLTLTVSVDVFWKFFEPSFLFFNPAGPGFCGVFLIPVALLIGVGILDTCRSTLAPDRAAARAPIVGVMLIGFLVGPLAAATFKEPPAIQRALVMVPFGVLLAALGADALFARAQAATRVVAALLLIAVPFQFAFAYRRLIASPAWPPASNLHDGPSTFGR
jgi:4-amino-4-deoxy-L-arabinose transferase-like glycosyltransferase